MDRWWEYIDRSQTHEYVNVENGTEAAQFLFWVYINRNFFAVCEPHFSISLFQNVWILFSQNLHYFFRCHHTSTFVPRLPQCLYSRPNWDPPPLLPQAYPPKPKGGGGTLACG
jgi:hypothetical protein